MLIANPLNGSSLAFPVLGSLHLIGMLGGLGTAAVVDLRLLRSGASGVWRETYYWTLGGLLLSIFSGLLLLSIAMEDYLGNPVFHFKLTVLAAALAFYYTLVRRAASRDTKSPVIAAISLVLYALVPLSGIFLGYE